MATRQFQLTADDINKLRYAQQQTRDAHELKRLQAVRLYGSGVAISEIEPIVNCSESSIRHWVQRYQRGGVAGLQSQWQGGNASKLRPDQRAEIKQRLHEYRPDQILPPDRRVTQGRFWTVSDLRIALRQWYGVTYKKDDSYHHLFHECGLSYQRTQKVYRSRPAPQVIADFEAELEKK